jgi:hypothetical protein
MFDLFDSIGKLIYILKDAVVLAKERTPTQRDRIAEALFTLAVKASNASNMDSFLSEANAAGINCYIMADAFLEGKEQYEKDRKNKA